MVEQKNFSHQIGQHTHAPNLQAVSALKLQSKLKRDTHDTDTTTNNITNIGEMYVLAELPHNDAIQQDVRRQWAGNQPYPEIPGNTLFEIPNPYSVSSMGGQYVQFTIQFTLKVYNVFKIVKIGLWMGHFLLDHHSLSSFILSMGLVIEKIL